MLTFFTTAKPFQGHSSVIQRNALQSWKRLDPGVEVILFGDDAGAAEVSEELGLRHEPHVDRNEFGSKRLDYMFYRAQSISRHDLVCYLNCDIILLSDFSDALARVRAAHSSFLMVGRRWDTPIAQHVDFRRAGIADQLRHAARTTGNQRGPDCIDYFVFPRGLYAEVPPLVVGRNWWDHWLAWQAPRLGAAVVDVSACVCAIHQNHDYGYHPAGHAGVSWDEQAQRNYQLTGGRWHQHTIADATHVLEPQRERRNLLCYWAPYWRVLRPKVVPFWFAFLGVTRPLRRVLGLRRPALASRHER